MSSEWPTPSPFFIVALPSQEIRKRALTLSARCFPHHKYSGEACEILREYILRSSAICHSPTLNLKPSITASNKICSASERCSCQVNKRKPCVFNSLMHSESDILTGLIKYPWMRTIGLRWCLKARVPAPIWMLLKCFVKNQATSSL